MRAALTDCGVPTLDSDVMVMSSGYPTLSIAQGVLVWCNTERFRWPGESDLWVQYPVSDPEGAASRLAAQLADDPVLKLRRAFPGWTILRFAGDLHFCAAPARPELAAAPFVEAGTPEDLAELLRIAEKVA
ncbi:hypothetical protein [Streptosporangium sandarakinum]|uniref:hypothetical protein n=1 Tax=Streptosporangium sandarakinum TaxID=1260955 RepID=UPI0037892A42